MIDALRFALSLAGILLGLFLVWLGLRFYGESQPISSYQTPLVKKLSEHKGVHWTAPDQSGKKFIYLKAINKENHWTVSNMGKEESLEKFLKTLKDQFLLLDITLKTPTDAPSFKKILDASSNLEKIVITSRSDGTLKDLRELSPKWSFTNGEVFLARFMSLNSIGLGALLKIKSDVFIIHTEKIPLSLEFESLIKEANRQNKITIIGPVPGPLAPLSPQGWLIRKQSH